MSEVLDLLIGAGVVYNIKGLGDISKKLDTITGGIVQPLSSKIDDSTSRILQQIINTESNLAGLMGAVGKSVSEWTVVRVLRAKDVGLSVGVGTPFIIRDLDTEQLYMLFTGWDDQPGQARRIFVAPMDEYLNVDVKKVREIASPSLFGVTGLNTVHAFWDDKNEQWVLFSTFYGGPSSSVAGVIFLDKDFNVKGTKTLDFGVNLSDGGVSPVPLFTKGLLLTGGYGRPNRSIFAISDFTARPLPTPTRLNVSGTTSVPILSNHMENSADVHQTLLLDKGIVMISELTNHRAQWYIQVYYGAEKDWYVQGSWIPFMFVPPAVPPLPIHFTEVIGNIGHPHYTNYLREPWLFFVRFPTWDVGGSRAYAHDIWAVRIDPEYVFNPKGKTLMAFGQTEPYQTGGKPPIPTFGARKITIYIYGASGSGTLYLYEGTSPYHIWRKSGAMMRTSYSINQGDNKIVVDGPVAPWIGLETTVNIGEYAVIIDT